jgi:uncharacterized spore protein YtfJ
MSIDAQVMATRCEKEICRMDLVVGVVGKRVVAGSEHVLVTWVSVGVGVGAGEEIKRGSCWRWERMQSADFVPQVSPLLWLHVARRPSL